MIERIPDFMAYLRSERGFSENTISAYQNDLAQLAGFVRSGPVEYDLLDRGTISGFILHLREREYAPTTVARKVAAVKSFCHFLRRQGLTDVDPTDGIASPRVSKYLPRAASEDEIGRLLAQLDGSSPAVLRDKAMLELLYATGVRVTELVSLDLSSVDFDRNTVTCTGKGGRSRDIPFGAGPREALLRYVGEPRSALAAAHASPALFLNHHGERLTRQGFWLIVKGYARQAGITGITPQMLRHSFAVLVRQDSAALRVLQEVLARDILAGSQVAPGGMKSRV
jgi:integrase/recombinase XerD